MGRNGAGKSTLLKVIAGTLSPASGEVIVNGRVSAILELGTGFHPDYTGRQNVVNALIYAGFTRHDAEKRLPQIVDFAELEEFIDRPFKTYSSGMQARLSFASAVSVSAEILIVDEALSVGDARFQLKCFDHIRSEIERGVSVMLVSHAPDTVASVCSRAYVLEGGRNFSEGSPLDIVKDYHALIYTKAPEKRQSGPVESERSRFGNQHVTIDRLEFSGKGTPLSFESGEAFELKMLLSAKRALQNLSVGILIRNGRGVDVFGTSSTLFEDQLINVEEGEKKVVSFKGEVRLGGGTYFLSAGVSQEDEEKCDFIQDGLEFSVSRTPHAFTNSIADLGVEICHE
jgi:ABC-type polysaccharide/polyol phosphate transport system ATPase subunit